MNKKTGFALALLVAALAAGAGYWLGNKDAATHASGTLAGAAGGVKSTQASADKQEKKLLYYRNPMGLPDTSPTPKKDPMGMDLSLIHI